MTETPVVRKVQPAMQRGLSREEAAAYCGLSTGEFCVLVFHDHRMPLPVSILGRELWDRRQLDQALGDLFARAHLRRKGCE